MALLTVSVGLFALAGSLIYSTRAASSSGRHTQALGYANRLLQLTKFHNLPDRAPINDSAATRTPLNAAPFVGEVDAAPLFRRNLRMMRLSQDLTDYHNELYQVDVSVFWSESGGEKKVTVSGMHRAR